MNLAARWSSAARPAAHRSLAPARAMRSLAVADCRRDLEAAAGRRRLRRATEAGQQECEGASRASSAVNLCRRPQAAAAGLASRSAAAWRAYGPCRSAADTTSRPGTGGSAEFGAGPDVVERPAGGMDARGRIGPLPSPPGGVVREFTVSPHALTPPVAQPTFADARSLLAYVPPKFARGEPPPRSRLEVNMAKAGTAAFIRSGGGRPMRHWSRQNRMNSKARRRSSAFSNGAAPGQSRSPQKDCPG